MNLRHLAALILMAICGVVILVGLATVGAGASQLISPANNLAANISFIAVTIGIAELLLGGLILWFAWSTYRSCDHRLPDLYGLTVAAKRPRFPPLSPVGIFLYAMITLMMLFYAAYQGFDFSNPRVFRICLEFGILTFAFLYACCQQWFQKPAASHDPAPGESNGQKEGVST